MEQEEIKLPSEFRSELRAGTGKLVSTSGLCPGFQQANFGFVPSDQFENFSKFCEANPGKLVFLRAQIGNNTVEAETVKVEF